MRLNTPNRGLLACCLMIAVLCFSTLLPLGCVFSYAFSNEGERSFLSVILREENLSTVMNSLVLGALVVIVTSIISTPLAFILARTSLGRSAMLDVALLIPFMTPPYIAAMGWILFMQKRGLMQQLFPGCAFLTDWFFSLGGMVLVMSLHTAPFMITMLKNAILNVGLQLEESAAVCGASRSYRFRHVLLPLLSGNYAIAMLLVFVKTMSEYGTPSTLGKRIGYYVFTTDIHRYATTAPVDFGSAASLSSVLILICMLMWMLQNFVTSRHTYGLISARNRGSQCYRPGRRCLMMCVAAVGIYILLGIVIPYFSVIATSLIRLRGFGLRAGNFTLMHYVELFTENDKGFEALLTSLKLAFSVGLLGAAIGTVIALAARKGGRLGRPAEGLALLPQMLPNIVLVIALMIFFNRIYEYLPLYNTLYFMVFAYTVMFVPYGVQYVKSALMQSGDTVAEAGRICGGSETYVFMRITLPLISLGVVQSFMMIFIIVFRELVAASLISPPDVLVVSTFIVREFEQGSASVAMAMALLCVLISCAIMVGLRLILRQRRRFRASAH